MELHELKAEGLSIREIARRTGHSRNTVRKALRERKLPSYGPRAKKGSKLDPFKKHLSERIAVGVTNAQRLFDEVQAQGYTGGYTLVREFVQGFRKALPPKATVRFETKPGEQAQVDFGVFEYETDGKRHKLNAFVMVLSYSRMTYVEFVERQDLTTFIRCHVHACHQLGVPQKILYDNLKAVVNRRDAKGQPELNQRFLDFALVAGFHPQLCRPRRPQTKGRVERTVRYLREYFWPGRTFTTLFDLNQQVQVWCEEIANQRIHNTTKRRPVEMLPEERLGRLPDAATLEPFVLEERKVGRDGFVEYQRSRYGVPWQFAGQMVLIRESAGHVEILAQGRQIALHPKALYHNTQFKHPKQWDGLVTGERVQRRTVALQIPSPEVQVRSLDVYAALGGGEVE